MPWGVSGSAPSTAISSSPLGPSEGLPLPMVSLLALILGCGDPRETEERLLLSLLAHSSGWLDASSQCWASPAHLSFPLGSCWCGATVTAELCRGLGKQHPSTWSPDLLGASLWEESNPRASEATLPLSGPSTLQPMPADAQSVGTALTACPAAAQKTFPSS